MLCRLSWPTLWSRLAVLAIFVSIPWEAGLAQASVEFFEPLRPLVAQHPDVVAAQARLDAARERRSAASRLAYDPELELEGTRADTRDYSVGLSQQLDWSGRRKAKTEVATAAWEAARAEYRLTVNRVASELAMASVEATSAQDHQALIRQRRDLVARLSELVRKRQRAGDAPQADVDLARFALSGAADELGEAAAQADRAREALARAALASVPAPIAWSQTPPDSATAARAFRTDHPEVQLAMALADQAKGAVQLARADTRSDPTLSISGGRESDESRVGLGLSIPLPIFTGVRRELAAANNERRATEAELERMRRDLALRIAATARRLNLAREAHADWQAAVGQRLEASGELLERLLATGDLDVASYLVHLEQRIAGLEAGVNARTRWWRAWVEHMSTQAVWADLLEPNS